MKDDSENKQLNSIKITKIFLDTNVLMSYSSQLFNKYKDNPNTKFIICGFVLNELDNHKMSFDESKKYKARQASRDIEANQDKIEYVVRENNFEYNLPLSFDKLSMDNKIIGVLNNLYFSNEEFGKENGIEIFALSNDLLFRQKCRLLGIRCDKFDGDDKSDEVYNGIRKLILTEQEYVNLLENPNDFSYNFQPNEYIIIHNTTSNDEYLFTWNKYFEEVKIKPLSNKYVNKITPLDTYQKAFIHMLQNDNIKVKITDSRYGVGKSFLMIHWALHMLDKEKVDKLYFVKSDSPPKNRREFPAIPGGIVEKTSPLLGVLCDATSEDNIMDILLRNNRLEILPIQFAKGRSLRNSILYINEAQDFTPSEMERLLSRISEGTFVLLDGSTSQIDNRYCLNRNGLSVVSNNFKDKYISAQVNMVEDYRSEISKMISDMDWND